MYSRTFAVYLSFHCTTHCAQDVSNQQQMSISLFERISQHQEAIISWIFLVGTAYMEISDKVQDQLITEMTIAICCGRYLQSLGFMVKVLPIDTYLLRQLIPRLRNWMAASSSSDCSEFETIYTCSLPRVPGIKPTSPSPTSWIGIFRLLPSTQNLGGPYSPWQVEIIFQLDLPNKHVYQQHHIRHLDLATSLEELSNDTSVFKLAWVFRERLNKHPMAVWGNKFQTIAFDWIFQLITFDYNNSFRIEFQSVHQHTT